VSSVLEDHWCPAKGPSPERSRSDGMLSRPVRQQPHAIHESCALSATESQSAQMPITWLHRPLAADRCCQCEPQLVTTQHTRLGCPADPPKSAPHMRLHAEPDQSAAAACTSLAACDSVGEQLRGGRVAHDSGPVPDGQSLIPLLAHGRRIASWNRSTRGTGTSSCACPSGTRPSPSRCYGPRPCGAAQPATKH
jgi:hypothetical protein